jgi:hypothetical protein
MELPYHLYVLFFNLLFVLNFLLAGIVEPVVEQFGVAEYLREEEVEQTP